MLALPNVPWLTLPSDNASGDLAPGATAKLELQLNPDPSLPLGLYTGTLALNGTNAGISIPFAFNCVSTAVGDLKVVAQDEFSFFADTHPNVAGAHVVLSDVTTGAVVVDADTGPDGTLAETGVTEGDYNVDVTAAGHTSYHGTLHLIAGETNEIDAFLSRQLVTYTWDVVPIPFTDQYTVTLDAVFETHVPAPVVMVSPTQLDLSKVVFDSHGVAVVNYTLTNVGLIAANNSHFNIKGNQDYTITPALTSVGTIPPLSSVIVPVTIVKTGASVLARRSASAYASPNGFGSCFNDVFNGLVDWAYRCIGPQTGVSGFFMYSGAALAAAGICGINALVSKSETTG